MTEEIINKICAQLPEGWEIALYMEKDTAWIELWSSDEEAFVTLADPTDKTIVDQLNDTLCVAKGWGKI